MNFDIFLLSDCFELRMVEIFQLIGTILAVLIVAGIILLFWTLLWKFFLSRFKFVREICKFFLKILGFFTIFLVTGDQEKVQTKELEQISEEQARKEREERIARRRTRKAD